LRRLERAMRIRNTKLYLARRSQAVQEALREGRRRSASAARGSAARKAAARKAAAAKGPRELADEAV
jgi:hypothetical protein